MTNLVTNFCSKMPCKSKGSHRPTKNVVGDDEFLTRGEAWTELGVACGTVAEVV